MRGIAAGSRAIATFPTRHLIPAIEIEDRGVDYLLTTPRGEHVAIPKTAVIELHRLGLFVGFDWAIDNGLLTAPKGRAGTAYRKQRQGALDL